MTTATDIAALKARCTALEKRATATEGKTSALSTAATALTARVAKLEAVKPIDYSAQIAALQKEVAALRYIISPTSFNVRDYGAKGDGVTDDTAAIQAAVDACATVGGTVSFAPGVYTISSPIELPPNVTNWIRLVGNGAMVKLVGARGFLNFNRTPD